MPNVDKEKIFSLIRPITDKMARLTAEERIILLQALLAQEVCMLPPSERRPEMRRIIDQMPAVLRSTEEGMRQALTENARDDA